MNEKVWVEIDKKILISNIQQFKKHIDPDVKLLLAVKSNAYGHDIELVSKVAQENGSDWLGVDSLREAIFLREKGIELPILVLGYIDPLGFEIAIENNISFVVYNRDFLDEINLVAKNIGKKAKIHLKVETGTNRQGILLQDFEDFIKKLKTLDNIFVQGLYSHYANIEDTTVHNYAVQQLNQYKEFLKVCEKNNFDIPLKHNSCSAATILFPKTHFNMVRVGISTYGLWSSTETQVSAKEKNLNIDLNPILTWKTVVAQVKTIPAGSCISYGCTEKVAAETKIAVLPIGYWDGYDRKLSSVGNVLINGQRAKILGRICMNMCMADVTAIDDIKAGDEVVLLGKQGQEQISAEEIANKIGTINYEVVTRINPLIKRILK